MVKAIECPRCHTPCAVPEGTLSDVFRCGSCHLDFTIAARIDETGAGRSSAPASASTPPSAGVESNEPPDRVGPYVLKRRLGAGTMGEVWLAFDPTLERDIAVKILPSAFSEDPDRLKRFLREARLAAKLDHPHTVPIHQAGVEGNRAYIAMQYVGGGSLEDATSEGRHLPWREATRIICEATSGLGAAHAQGLIHRDIKPANLMRTTDGAIKVVDFGLARAQVSSTQLTQLGMRLGTPAYMAPEQWKGQEADARSDLYALVCSYYQLLTGRLPFDSSTLASLGYQHCAEPLPDPRESVSSLPDEVCRILVKGMQKDREDRYQTAAELVADLQAALALGDDAATSGKSWQELAATPCQGEGGQEGSRQDVQPAETQRVGRTRNSRAASWQKGSGRTPRPQRSPAGRGRRVTGLAVAVLGVAGILALAIVFYVRTATGMVKIELADSAVKAAIKVDGDTVEIEGLSQPLHLKVGQHELEVTSSDFRTFTKSFTVKRGETEVVRVTLEPIAEPPPAITPVVAPPEKPKQTEKPKQVVAQSAEYTVTIALADAKLTVSGDGATVSGEGPVRTLTIAAPDGQTAYSIEASRTGYQTLRQEFRPQPGEHGHIDLRLEPLPQSMPKEPTPPAPADLVTNSIGMKLVLVPAGTFTMGSRGGDPDEQPPHTVRITKPFYLGQCEVTVGQFRKFIEEKQYDAGTGWQTAESLQTDDHPVIMVSWHDAKAFCEWLSQKEAKEYRLPTEAEWEYACRAGTQTEWSFGDNESDLESYAWFSLNAGGQTHPVGQKRPNAWGLYDMHGNASEWCEDWYGEGYHDAPPADDPAGPSSGAGRVFRGGSWYNTAHLARSSGRYMRSPEIQDVFNGFRIAMTAGATASPPSLANAGKTEVAKPKTTETASLKATSPRRPQAEEAARALERAHAAILAGEYDRAIADCTKAIELDPHYAAAYNNRGTAYYRKREYGLAIVDYDKAIEINPQYASAYCNRGAAYLDKGDYAQVIADSNKAIDLNPREAAAYNNRGFAYLQRREYDLAIADYDKAIEINPKYARAYRNRGNAYWGKKEYDRAIADHDKAIELDPSDALAYFNRGNGYLNKGEVGRAIADFSKAIELDPKKPGFYNDRGVAHFQKREYDAAIADYEKAIELNARFALAYRNRGNAYLNKEAYDRAIADYSQAIELDPNDVAAKNARAKANDLRAAATVNSSPPRSAPTKSVATGYRFPKAKDEPSGSPVPPAPVPPPPPPREPSARRIAAAGSRQRNATEILSADGSMKVTVSPDGSLKAVDREGRQIWEHTAVGAPSRCHGMVNIGAARLCCLHGSTLRVMDWRTGQLIWKSTVNIGPTAAIRSKGSEVIVESGTSVIVFDSATGRKLSGP